MATDAAVVGIIAAVTPLGAAVAGLASVACRSTADAVDQVDGEVSARDRLTGNRMVLERGLDRVECDEVARGRGGGDQSDERRRQG